MTPYKSRDTNEQVYIVEIYLDSGLVMYSTRDIEVVPGGGAATGYGGGGAGGGGAS